MATINHLEGYAFAKKKGDTIHVFEGPHTLSDFLPVMAEGTDVPRMLKDRFSDVVNVKDFGAAGDRYGIRYEELLMLECARLRREIASLKAVLKNKILI